MAYSKQSWADGDPSKPLSAARMNHIEDGIEAAALSGGGGLSEEEVDARVVEVGGETFAPAAALETKVDRRQKLRWKTVSVSLREDRDWSLYVEELDHIANHGGEVVLVILDQIPSDTGSTFVRVTQAKIDSWFALAASKGVSVAMIKPHIVTAAAGDAFYRGNYQPSDVNAFFTNWQAEMVYFANLAAAHNVPILCVSCEQFYQTKPTYNTQWQTLINAVRAAQPGLLLTAAFTTAELFDMVFSHLPAGNHMSRMLDFIGINSWVKLTTKVYTPATPNITQADDLNPGWWRSAQADYHLDRIHLACDYLGVGYFITEVGCQPTTDGLSLQSGGVTTGAKTYVPQAMMYRSVFDVLCNSDWCLGVSIWSAGGPFNYYDRVLGTPTPVEPVTASEQVLVDYYKGGLI